MTNHFLLDYQKKKREVDRILLGPIPVEVTPKMAWSTALTEAEVALSYAKEVCILAGIDV